MRAIRTLLVSCGVFAGAVTAHFLGQGSFHFGNSHFFFMGVIALAAIAISKDSLSGPKLAMVIALAQFATHFFFSTSGNADLSNQTRMGLSHILLGLVSYLLIVRIENLVELFFNLVDQLVLLVFAILKSLHTFTQLVNAGVALCYSKILAHDLAQRGPPVITFS